MEKRESAQKGGKTFSFIQLWSFLEFSPLFYRVILRVDILMVNKCARKCKKSFKTKEITFAILNYKKTRHFVQIYIPQYIYIYIYVYIYIYIYIYLLYIIYIYIYIFVIHYIYIYIYIYTYNV